MNMMKIVLAVLIVLNLWFVGINTVNVFELIANDHFVFAFFASLVVAFNAFAAWYCSYVLRSND